MNAYEAEYSKKTPTSARLFAESAKMHINGVSHNIRYFEPYPFVVKSSEGGCLIDVDGNRYTDYWMGHWSLIQGHAPKHVVRSLHDQLEDGWMYGAVNEQTIKLSKIISGAVPAAEKIRYTASGTEAVMYAARLARTHTKRDVIAKVDGGWHGYGSDLLKSVNWPFKEPESSGLVGADNIVSVPYNDLDATVKILSGCKSRLAGIIVEPVLGGAGGIPASAEYLAGVQEFVHGCGALFILDEIVTGFRFRYGCMYESMPLEPDVITLGKIIGGGMPVGAVCGADEIMAHADASSADRSYIGGGTFSANPASMTAGRVTLEYMRDNQSTYDRISSMGARARSGITGVLGDEAADVTGAGSIFMVHFAAPGKRHTGVRNAEQAASCDQDKLRQYHLKMIAQDGIFMLPGKMGAISSAHADGDIERLVAASEDFKRHRQ